MAITRTEKSMQTLITGGTGFIGRNLAASLPGAVIAGRSLAKINRIMPGRPARIWEPACKPSPDLLAGIDAIVHLAGESIFHGRWNKAKKERIKTSRIIGTRHLVRAIGAAKKRPRALVCASAVGIYGNREQQILDEKSAPGTDFLARLCQDWEKEALQAGEYGLRVILLRLGVVLGRDGGALTQMLPPFRMGLGGRLGSGNQYMAWIHILDLCRMVSTLLRDDSISGPINAVAPAPVTNRQFTDALARTLHRPALLPLPAFLLKLLLGEFAEVLLASQRVVPAILPQKGFRFRYPEIAPALADLVSGS